MPSRLVKKQQPSSKLILRGHIRPDDVNDSEGNPKPVCFIDDHESVDGIVSVGIDPVSVYANENDFLYFAFLTDEVDAPYGVEGDSIRKMVEDATLGIGPGPKVFYKEVVIARRKTKSWFSRFKNMQ